MQKKWSFALTCLVTYATYLFTMAELPAFLNHLLGNWPEMLGYRFATRLKDPVLLYFCLGHLAIFGAIIPLYLAKKFDLKPHRKVPSAILWPSIVALVGSFLFYAHFQGFLTNMLHPDPDLPYMTEAFFYIFPFSLGLCVYSCFLIPRAVMLIMDGNKFSPILEAAAAIGSILISWQMYIHIGHILPEKIFWTGMVIAAAGALSRSFYLSFIACFATLYGASMVNPVFYEIPWEPILPGFLAAFVAFCLYLHSRDTRSFPHISTTNS
ncbi:hypothetical protein SAMN05660337_1573 [Maridesulfovibrio ferrireducens]|uniref:Uncharacterized protein n=1 Tax=Maridesulfovibrio ferrireducens TaxID=246191 RepID=A0A1G9FJT5_9BACT|nr:hypothetical protein [Maridesulfovibrio ferrireducens]SDK88612.1 hypothetical protein SAMN05660337_1573 [Maridesulfovibrio ferrireducens]